MRMLTIAVVLVCSSFAGSAAADEASHRKALAEFFKAMETEKMIEEGLRMMLDAQLQGLPLTEQQKGVVKEFVRKQMSWQTLEKDFIDLYAKTFSEAEIKQLLAFYRSPVGKKAVAELPKLMQAGSVIGARRVQEKLPELVEQLRKTQPAK